MDRVSPHQPDPRPGAEPERGFAVAVMALTGDEFGPDDLRKTDVYTLRDPPTELRAGIAVRTGLSRRRSR